MFIIIIMKKLLTNPELQNILATDIQSVVSCYPQAE